MESSPLLKIAVLVSGSGSNFQAIVDHIEAGKIPARIALIVSNKPDAYALKRAEKHGIPTVVHENKGFANRREYDAALVDLLKQHDVSLVIMAGFMRILSDVMINAFPHSIMNIHPALLPAFPGLDAQKQALEYGVRFSGCTVHFVDCGTDTGPIILQSVVHVEDNDTEETLAARILKEEHRTYPEAVRLFAEGKLVMEGRRVKILP